jgi:hypothetical protein
VPRYEAPAETVALARDVLTPFITVLSAEVGSAESPELVAELSEWMAVDPSVSSWVGRADDPRAAAAPRAVSGPTVSGPTASDQAGVLASVLRLWIRMHGVVSTEAAGTFQGMGLDPATLLTAEIDALTDALGLG